MSQDHVALFPDTNGLLHYPPLADVDWLAVCDAAKVTIVFCMQVIHELDEKKNDTRLGSRAERVIKEIKRIKENSNIIRKHVHLEIFNQELRADEFAGSLSPDSGDDRIVHLVKKYIAETGQKDVAVYTEDLGMNYRCEAHGIPTIEPDKSTRLENPQTEQDRKVRELQKENLELKNRQPKIDVLFTLPGDPAEEGRLYSLDLRRNMGRDPEQAVQEKRRELASKAPKEWHNDPNTMGTHGFTMPSLMRASQSEISSYWYHVEEYLQQYRKWILACNEIMMQIPQAVEYDIHVLNTGRGPADDVEIEILLPPRFQLLWNKDDLKGNMISLPKEPKVPEIPRGAFDVFKNIDALSRQYPPIDYSKLYKPPIAGKPLHWLDGDADSGFVVKIRIPSLVQHRSVTFGPFTTVFKSWSEASSCQVTATVTAANIAHRMELKFPLLINISGEPTSADTQRNTKECDDEHAEQ